MEKKSGYIEEKKQFYPRVTIVLGTYNQEKYICRAIESILNQTYKNVQLIINNNGSTDNTKEILRAYEGKENITVINYDKNNYLTKLENDAIEHAEGEFICFFAGDDYYLPTYIEEHINAFSKLSDLYGIVYSPHYVENELTGEKWIEKGFSESGNVIDELIESQLTAFMSPNTSLMRTNVVKEIRPNQSIFCEGEGRYLRIAAKYRLQYLDKPLCVMTDHLTNQGKNYKANSRMFFETSLRLKKELPEKSKLIDSVIYGMFLRNAWLSIRLMDDKTWAKECMEIARQYSESIELSSKIVLLNILIRTNVKIIKLFNKVMDYMLKGSGKNKRNNTYVDYDYN